MSIYAAIVSQAWAILPDALEAIFAIAERDSNHPALAAMRAEAEKAGRWPPNPQAIMVPGAVPLEGAPRAYRKDSVAVIPVMGPIFPHASMFSEVSGAASVDGIAQAMRAANANDDVRAIAMVFDTPGGAVTGIGELAAKISTSQKPVNAFGYGSVASAGYWLASAAKSLTLSPTSLAGSIGVVAALPVTESHDRSGRRMIEIVSSNAPKKRLDPRTDEGVAAMRETLDAIEAEFITTVAKNRRVSRETVLSDFGQGGLLTGRAAVVSGMADAVGTLDQWLEKMAADHPGPARKRLSAESYLASKG